MKSFQCESTNFFAQLVGGFLHCLILPLVSYETIIEEESERPRV